MLSSKLKSDLLGLKNKLESLGTMIEENPDEAREKETDKEQKVNFLNTEDKINQLLSNDKVIKLNIGGKIFKTKSSTLNNFPNSLFAQTLQKLKPEEDEIFFDRSFKNFKIILNFLREKKIYYNKINKYEREDLLEEIKFYKLEDQMENSKLVVEYDLGWDLTLSKSGACHLDSQDDKRLIIHSNTCYTHFITNIQFTNQNFEVEMEYNVQQTDFYLYFGIVNETYNFSNNCMCCTNTNSIYVQCNGDIKVNGSVQSNGNFNWGSRKVILGMRAILEERKVYFYIDEKSLAGPFDLIGTKFRVVGGHCNAGNGYIKILSCHELSIDKIF